MDGDPKMLMEMIMKALESSGYSNRGGADDGLAGMDPDNQVRGWSGITLTKGADDRPTLADKDYVIEKLALDGGQDMPDAGGGGEMNTYTRPF